LTDNLRPPPSASPPRTTSADILRWFSPDDDRQLRCAVPTVAEFINGRCAERYLVTLTDRRQLSSQDFSQNVGRALHHTNKAFFGTHYKRRRTTFLSEAVPLIEAGYHIRMGRRGVRPSLIAKDSLIIHQPA
jgi:hypothetical protein